MPFYSNFYLHLDSGLNIGLLSILETFKYKACTFNFDKNTCIHHSTVACFNLNTYRVYLVSIELLKLQGVLLLNEF